LDVVIRKDGHVLRVEPISGHEILVDAAKQAVIQWVYTPTLLNNEPIEVVVEVQITFPPKKSAKKVIRCG
jgi:protein TonB